MQEEDATLRRELETKLHNVDHENRNLDIYNTLQVKPRSLLIPPEKPELKARMPNIFSKQGSVSFLESEKTSAKLNADATQLQLDTQPIQFDNSSGIKSNASGLIANNAENSNQFEFGKRS